MIELLDYTWMVGMPDSRYSAPTSRKSRRSSIPGECKKFRTEFKTGTRELN